MVATTLREVFPSKRYLSVCAFRVLRILMVFYLLSPLAFMAADFILIQHLQIMVVIAAGCAAYASPPTMGTTSRADDERPLLSRCCDD